MARDVKYIAAKQRRWNYYSVLIRFVVCRHIVAEPATYRLPKSLVRRTYRPEHVFGPMYIIIQYQSHYNGLCDEIILTALLLNWVYSNTMKSCFSLSVVYVWMCAHNAQCTKYNIYAHIHRSKLYTRFIKVFYGLSVSISFAFYVPEVGWSRSYSLWSIVYILTKW